MLPTKTAIAIILLWGTHGLRPHQSNIASVAVEEQLNREMDELLERTEINADGSLSLRNLSLGNAPENGTVRGARADGFIASMGRAAAQIALLSMMTGNEEPLSAPSEHGSSKNFLGTSFIELAKDLRSGVKVTSSALQALAHSIKRHRDEPVGFVSSEMGPQDGQVRLEADFRMMKGNWMIQYRSEIKMNPMANALEIRYNRSTNDYRSSGNLKWLEFPQNVRFCYRKEKVFKTFTFDYFCFGLRPALKYYPDKDSLLIKDFQIISFFGLTRKGKPIYREVKELDDCMKQVDQFVKSQPDEISNAKGWRKSLGFSVYTEFLVGPTHSPIGPWKRWAVAIQGANGKWGKWVRSEAEGIAGEVSPRPGEKYPFEMQYVLWDLGLDNYDPFTLSFWSFSPYMAFPVLNLQRAREKREKARRDKK